MIIYLSKALYAVAAVILIAATFVLHRRFRSSSSLFLLVAVLLVFGYKLLAPAILIFVRIHMGGLDEFWLWHRVAHPALMLLVALAFLRVVLVDLRAKNS